jgi:hypothetical protein
MTELQAFYLRVSVHCDISSFHSGVALSDSLTLQLRAEQSSAKSVAHYPTTKHYNTEHFKLPGHFSSAHLIGKFSGQ